MLFSSFLNYNCTCFCASSGSTPESTPDLLRIYSGVTPELSVSLIIRNAWFKIRVLRSKKEERSRRKKSTRKQEQSLRTVQIKEVFQQRRKIETKNEEHNHDRNHNYFGTYFRNSSSLNRGSTRF